MVVSYLRSCYRTLCRFYPDRPDILTPIRWYFLPDGAPELPFLNTFTARMWYDNQPMSWPLLGEVEGAERQWVDGTQPEIMLPSACRLVPSDWVNGIPYALHDTNPHTMGGILLCCIGAPPVAVNQVTSPDGSLTISPTTGNVEAVINLGHSNAWAILQTFLSSADATAALRIIERATQTAAAFQLTDNSGTVILSVLPNAGLLIRSRTGGGLPLRIDDDSGNLVYGVDTDGSVRTTKVVTTGTLGNYIGRWPLYDDTGAEIGCVPLYDCLTTGATVLEDAFTDTNGTLLQAHAISPTNAPVTEWIPILGTWDIQGNAANVSASTGSWDIAICDLASGKGQVEAVIPNANNFCAVCMRCAPNGDGWYAITGAAWGQLRLFQRANGQFFLKQSAAFTPSGSPETLKLKCEGSSVRGEIGSASVVVTSKSFERLTFGGIGTFNAGSTVDSFKFVT